MAVVAQAYDFVVGIDTHSKTHTLAIISAVTGAEIANETFPSTSTGMKRALGWISRRSTGDKSRVLLSMEGTGSYGAKFRQLATESDYRVIEAPFPERRIGRKRGKVRQHRRSSGGQSCPGNRDERASRTARRPTPYGVTSPNCCQDFDGSRTNRGYQFVDRAVASR